MMTMNPRWPVERPPALSVPHAFHAGWMVVKRACLAWLLLLAMAVPSHAELVIDIR
ncbi:MAG: hypothetical protein HQL62_06350, partial [Magnetococcales bacterium]|nr:hypothetical protein [Magnetococcales bacterium]